MMKNVYEKCKKCKNCDEKYVSTNTNSCETHGCVKICFYPDFKLFEPKEIDKDKSCDTCGFSKYNNPDGLPCKTYRGKLGYDGLCNNCNKWKSIDDVKELTKKENKYCHNCGFSQTNNPEGMNCEDYREKLGIIEDSCIFHNKWKSIEDVKKIIENKNKEVKKREENKEVKTCFNCGFASRINPDEMDCDDYRKKLGVYKGSCGLGFPYWKSIDEVKELVKKQVKTCFNCGFSQTNNPEKIGCLKYRKKIGVYKKYCDDFDNWKSISEVEKLAKEKKEPKSCNNCGFSYHNNPEGMSCSDYKKKLGIDSCFCLKYEYWKSRDEVQELAKKQEKSCKTCGFSRDNNPEGINCNSYMRALNIRKGCCSGKEYWKSITEVEKMAENKKEKKSCKTCGNYGKGTPPYGCNAIKKETGQIGDGVKCYTEKTWRSWKPIEPKLTSEYNDIMDEQIELENNILQTQIDAQKVFLAKRSTPFLHWDLDKEVNQKTKQNAWSDCENCIYFSGFGNFCKNGGYCGEKNDVTECKKYKPKKKKEVKEMEKPKNLKEVEKRIEELAKKRKEFIELMYEYTENDDIYENIKFNSMRTYVFKKLTKSFRKYVNLSKKEAKFFEINGTYSSTIMRHKKLIYKIDEKSWNKIKAKLNQETIESFQKKIDKKIMNSKLKVLCTMAPCYEDKKKTKRTKILLQTCEACGADTPVEGNFCKECGKPVRF